MKNNLFVFGCSYTESFETNTIENYKNYKIWRGGNFPKHWSELLANSLNLNLVNYGVGGGSNQKILRTFCKHSNEIKKHDTVIIQWSHLHRFDWANNDYGKYDVDKYGFITFNSVPNNDNYKEIISNTTVEEILINRTLKPYIKELYDFMNFITVFCEKIKSNLFFWSVDKEILYTTDSFERKSFKNKFLLSYDLIDYSSFFSYIFNLGGETITMETDGFIQDAHLGEKGHQVQGSLFYEHIKNNIL